MANAGKPVYLCLLLVQGIKDLHASDMSNEEKAAACTSCYVKGRAVARSPRKASKQKKGQEIDAAVLRVGGRARANGKGKTVPFYDTEEVLCGQEQVGRAGANEPWMMQSPGPVRQATQVCITITSLQSAWVKLAECAETCLMLPEDIHATHFLVGQAYLLKMFLPKPSFLQS